jgi:PEP-CTERM motif
MNQFVQIWRGSLPRLALAGLAALASIGAHAQTYNYGGYYGGSYYGGGGYVPIPIPEPVFPPLPADVNTLRWSKNASSAYVLNQFTGDFYDQRVSVSITSSTGRVSTYRGHEKLLDPASYTRDGNGVMNTGAISDSLTWVAELNEDLAMTGGSFTLSNIRWDLSATGAANVWATASGTGIASTDLQVFTVAASAVSRTASYVGLDRLAMTSAAFNLMMRGIGADPDGAAYLSMLGATSNMGKLTMAAAVPEPGTWAQLGLGLVGLGALLRHQATRKQR